MSVPSRPAFRRSVAAAIAAAVLCVAGAAPAADSRAPVPPATATPAPAATAPTTPSTGTRIRQDATRDLDAVHVIGAVNDPQDAAAPEDTSVPELPMATDVGQR
ncbi:MAG: hypothetical protein ACTHOH_12720 [Lysobacteraceae bacterium]